MKTPISTVIHKLITDQIVPVRDKSFCCISAGIQSSAPMLYMQTRKSRILACGARTYFFDRNSPPAKNMPERMSQRSGGRVGISKRIARHP